MANIDIDEWLLNKDIDPTTTIKNQNGEDVFIHALLENHLKEQIGSLAKKPKCGGCKVKTKDRDVLIAFFKFFRDNGEANIGMTIEQFVDGFLNQSKP